MADETTKIDISVKDLNTAGEWIEGVVKISNALNKPVDLKITAAKTSINIQVSPGDDAKDILSGFVSELNARVPGHYATGPVSVSNKSHELKL
jgi:hypothetical protein